MLFLRILSSLIGIPIVLASAYLGGLWYVALFLLLVNLGINEYILILKAGGYRMPAAIGHIGVSLLIAALFTEQFMFVYTLLIVILFALFTMMLLDSDKLTINEAAMSFWGIVYLAGGCGFLILLRLLPDGLLYSYMLLIGVWLHDSAAYLVGVKWGVHKFAPGISPNKSVEGSLAGIGATIILFLSVSILSPGLMRLDPDIAVLFAVGISVFAQLGDLMESALKRQFKAKDSGRIIPGHGGILDRLDSFLVAAPFAYYFFVVVNML